MSREVPAAEIQVGDEIRYGSDPLFREVVGVRRGVYDDILIDVHAGGLVESIPPMSPFETIEVA